MSTAVIGLVVNPVAGVGGPAGLAGSDGEEVQRLARQRGAVSRAGERATAALRMLAASGGERRVLTASGVMGADAAAAAGVAAEVVYTAAGETTAADTVAAVRALTAAGAGLVLFAGGDGTARDVADGLAGTTAAGLGIPCGVKMYSPAFAVSPSAAGALAADWADGRAEPALTEVLDIDEAALREARVAPVLHAMMPVPQAASRTQSRKAPTPASERAAVRAAARAAVAAMRPGVSYLLGPGGTMAEVAALLGVDGSPLGVDVVRDGRLVRRAASETELLAEAAGGEAVAVVSVIGGQGFLLGRGNQQLSARVLRALGDDPLIVVAPEQKLVDLRGRPLLVDTGDPELDARLAGFVRVHTAPGTASMYPVAAPEAAAV